MTSCWALWEVLLGNCWISGDGGLRGPQHRRSCFYIYNNNGTDGQHKGALPVKAGIQSQRLGLRRTLQPLRGLWYRRWDPGLRQSMMLGRGLEVLEQLCSELDCLVSDFMLLRGLRVRLCKMRALHMSYHFRSSTCWLCAKHLPGKI